VRSLRMICSGVWRLRFMGLLLAKSGRLGSSHKDWFSFWGPRQGFCKAVDPALVHKRQWAFGLVRRAVM
jgi:hypothetical protein